MDQRSAAQRICSSGQRTEVVNRQVVCRLCAVQPLEVILNVIIAPIVPANPPHSTPTRNQLSMQPASADRAAFALEDSL
eukprot:COSAG06_NODE_854_length_11931_cov_55.985970_16_plen_79_part_00